MRQSARHSYRKRNPSGLPNSQCLNAFPAVWQIDGRRAAFRQGDFVEARGGSAIARDEGSCKAAGLNGYFLGVLNLSIKAAGIPVSMEAENRSWRHADAMAGNSAQHKRVGGQARTINNDSFA
jgi:hypothetical protein